MPADAWKSLTMTALRLLGEADGKGVDVAAVVDATIGEHPEIANVERFRRSLESFVRDMTADGPRTA